MVTVPCLSIEPSITMSSRVLYENKFGAGTGVIIKSDDIR